MLGQNDHPWMAVVRHIGESHPSKGFLSLPCARPAGTAKSLRFHAFFESGVFNDDVAQSTSVEVTAQKSLEGPLRYVTMRPGTGSLPGHKAEHSRGAMFWGVRSEPGI